MDAAGARARLENLLQWQAEPALTAGEVDDLFSMLPKTSDAAGLLPGADGYVDTYADDVRAYRDAAGEGWLWKAGKVAGQYGVSTGNGTRFDRDKAHEMCINMAAHFGVKGGARLGSVRLATANTAR